MTHYSPDQPMTDFLAGSSSRAIERPIAVMSTDLLTLWTRVEQTLRQIQNTVHVVHPEGTSVWDVHKALVDVRARLEPLRDRLLEHEDAVDALYWARTASHTGVQAVLTVLRARKYALNDLLFHLPSHPCPKAASTTHVPAHYK